MNNGPDSTHLRLGLPKGRMHDGVVALLADAGISVRASSRGYRPKVSLPGFDTKILKPQNIIEMLHSGSRDLGFAGSDWVQELGYTRAEAHSLVEVLDTGLDRVRLVVAAPKEMICHGELQLPEDRPLRVAAEMPTLTARWIESKQIDATIVRTYGATEVFPPEDADCIVDIAASGDTLRANGLEIIDTVLESSTRLFANRSAYDDPAKRSGIDQLAILIRSVLDARQRVMLDLNVGADQLDRVIDILPCMREPTIAALRGEGGYAVRAAVPRDSIAELIPALQAQGATDLVVSRPTQIVR